MNSSIIFSIVVFFLTLNAQAAVLTLSNVEANEIEIGKYLSGTHAVDLFSGLKGQKKKDADRVSSDTIAKLKNNLKQAQDKSNAYDSDVEEAEAKLSQECQDGLYHFRYAARVTGFFSKGWITEEVSGGVNANYFTLPESISGHVNDALGFFVRRAMASVRKDVETSCAGQLQF